MRVGIIGVGNISGQYFDSLTRLDNLELARVADIDEARAASVGADHDVPGGGVDDLLADESIGAVINLTIPAAHAEVQTRILESGKHAYTEKPFALQPDDAKAVLALSKERGLRVGIAPDTFIGTGIQTSIHALDEGMIGEAVAATAFWAAPGHELWHPAPAFYYQPGGGPIFDMGPYYVTALIALLGPVVRVSGAVTTSARERTVATGPLAGTAIPVAVDTHATAVLEHASGAPSSITVSYEGWASHLPRIEVYGTQGTLNVPDPNRFSDPASVYTAQSREWNELPVSAGYENAGRGYGLADMAHAIETDRPHRVSGELGLHALEVMDAIYRAGHEHRVIELTTTVERPSTVPLGSLPWTW